MSVSFQRFDIFSMITPWQIVVKCVIFFFFQVKTREGGYKLKKANTNNNNHNNHNNNCLLYDVKIDFNYISQLYKRLQRCQREQAINYCNDYTLKKLFLVQ